MDKNTLYTRYVTLLLLEKHAFTSRICNGWLTNQISSATMLKPMTGTECLQTFLSVPRHNMI